MAVALQQGQYVATDKDNVAVVPQPGDVEITDAFGNVFDNFNQYGVVTGADKDTAKNRLVAFYDEENVLKNPQPGYQNTDYVQYLSNNTPKTPAWEPDAAQWIPRNVENQVRTPEPYVKSPLFPGGIPTTTHSIPTIEVVLTLEHNEALVVTEDDVNTIELVDVLSIPQVVAYIRSQPS